MSNIAANPISKAFCRMTTKDLDPVPMIGVAGIEFYVVLTRGDVALSVDGRIK
jgi:hypothetical protein